MPGPDWSDDDPTDAGRIAVNAGLAAADAGQMAGERVVPTADDLRRWHSTVYADCSVPSTVYVGRFRGEPYPDVADYEVGVGPIMADGHPDRVGVWAADVHREVTAFTGSLATALDTLDQIVAPGARPTEVAILNEVVGVVAAAHGEWVRIHPFVNGNGRTARLLAAHIAVRYRLPVFVTLKPRPHDVAYARAARASMGRPPDFVGDHSEAEAVFLHLLALLLLNP